MHDKFMRKPGNALHKDKCAYGDDDIGNPAIHDFAFFGNVQRLL